MNRKLHVVLGLLGIAVFTFGLTRMWSGVYLKHADKFIGSEGYELVAGQAALGLAVIAAVLMFVKPKLAAIPAVLMVACTVFAFLIPQKDSYSPQMGIYISAAGALMIIISSLIVPIPHPRR